MNILVISSIIKIPSALIDNDFIYQLYGTYRKKYKDDKVVIIFPVKYDFNIKTILKGRTRLQKLNKKLVWTIEDFRVEIFPFIAAWSIRNLHALVSRSIFYLNRRRIGDLFKAYQFDIVHARFIFADGILAYLIGREYRIPYVVSTHNELFYFDHFYSRKMTLKILRNASMILPVSYINVKTIESFGIKKVSQLTHGISGDFIRPQRTEPNEKVRILTISRLLKYKNLDKILIALEKLNQSHEFTYTLIGTGPEKSFLENMVQSLDLEDVVEFIESIPYDQVADEMNKYDIFILPSYFETFGRVYFEAMAMGLPIICAINSGIYGVFRENIEGLAVDHRNTDDIAEKLAFLIDNRDVRLEMGKNGQDLAKKYTWDNIAQKLHQTYFHCIAEFASDTKTDHGKH